MKKLWLILLLGLIFAATPALAKQITPSPWDPPKAPSIRGTWVGTGKFFSTLQQETSPYTIGVKIIIAAQSGELFNGTMELSYDTPIIPFTQITSLSFNIGGNISNKGDLVITGAAVMPHAFEIPMSDALTIFFKEEATASLVPGKIRRLTGDYRFTAQLPEAGGGFVNVENPGFAFPGTFDVQEQLAR
jgi:hypothetical protein